MHEKQAVDIYLEIWPIKKFNSYNLSVVNLYFVFLIQGIQLPKIFYRNKISWRCLLWTLTDQWDSNFSIIWSRVGYNLVSSSLSHVGCPGLLLFSGFFIDAVSTSNGVWNILFLIITFASTNYYLIFIIVVECRKQVVKYQRGNKHLFLLYFVTGIPFPLFRIFMMFFACFNNVLLNLKWDLTTHFSPGVILMII